MCVGGGGGSTLTSSRKDWAELYGCLRETENWNSSSKTLFYKDCSLGSVKNPSNN